MANSQTLIGNPITPFPNRICFMRNRERGNANATCMPANPGLTLTRQTATEVTKERAELHAASSIRLRVFCHR